MYKTQEMCITKIVVGRTPKEPIDEIKENKCKASNIL